MNHGVLFKISNRHVQVYYKPRYLFSNNFYSSRLLNFSNTTLQRELCPLKNKQLFFKYYICVERLCAFILSCRQNTEPKRLDSKKIRVNLGRTSH